MYRPPYTLEQTEKHSTHLPEDKRQWSVSDIWLRILGYLRGDRLQRVINEALDALLEKREIETLPARCCIRASLECQRSFALHYG